MKVIKIYVPMKYGSNYDGPDYGARIINESLKDDKSEIISIQGNPDSCANLKHLDIVINVSNKLAKVVKKTINHGAFPLIIGGDHSVALGSLSAIGTFNNNIGVFWIDAHADMNTAETTPSGNIHGMILASLQGYGNEKLTKILSNNVKIKTNNVVILGSRDLDEGEKKLIEINGLNNVSYDRLKNNFEGEVTNAIEFMKSNTRDVHISLDIDSIDPLIAPGVSTAVHSGLDIKMLYVLLDDIFNNFNVVAMDIVEYNPLKDINGMTLKIVLDIIKYVENKVSNE